MHIYFYSRHERGYYEHAYAQWRKHGGDFIEQLLSQSNTMMSWRKEFANFGHQLIVDPRGSYLLPQQIRAYLPLPIAQFMQGALWVTKIDRELLYRDILARIKKIKPDNVYINLGSAAPASLLEKIKSAGFMLWQWCDLPAKTMLERDRVNLPFFDLIVTPANLEAGFRAAGATAQIKYVPLAVDPNIYYPMQLTAEDHGKLGSDVCFVGGLGNQFHSERRKMVEYAIENGINIKIWGGYRDHFVNSPILKCWQGQIWGKDQVKALCAAKIGLNFHVNHEAGELDRGLNSRAFELAACGVFQLLQRVPSVEEFFEEDKEIVCFDTKEEMVDKLHFYLAHDDVRIRIANSARERLIHNHTWHNRIEQISNILGHFINP